MYNQLLEELYAEAKQDTIIDGMKAPVGVVAERFAELIIQECINVVEQQKAKMSYGPTFVIEDIKRHFGVKE